MKPKIKLRRISHRGQSRIAMEFVYDKKIIASIRTIESARWSKTNNCWYADDNEATLRKIINLLRELADIDISAISTHSEISEKVHNREPDDKAEGDSENIERGLSGGHIAGRSVKISLQVKENKNKATGEQRYDPVEFRISERDGQLAIRFLGYYSQEWIDEMRSYGRLRYNKRRKEFYLPWSVLTVDSLSDYFSSVGVEVRVLKAEMNPEKRQVRKDAGDEIRMRELSDKAKEALNKMENSLGDIRYSSRTNMTYLALLELFFKYFNTKDPLEITNTEVAGFIHDFVLNNGYSASYQNQMVSAIKYFYSIAGKGRIDLKGLERPRRSKALPKVFSKEEVKRILNSAVNLKHKLLLWMIYSCGLRRSEITNIRLSDLDRGRSILHIREGKGMVDRVVPVSDKVWEKLDEYIAGYSPSEFLFEGQGGGRYSSESVYRVFKQALHKAGIRKEVGVHSLRHSYATHLHESGLDIRYIQELLGHKSTRTTEIYTHVSRRDLVAVRSPIEDMDVK